MSIAFVPLDEVVRAFELLKAAPDQPQELQPVLDWFEKYYIGQLIDGILHFVHFVKPNLIPGKMTPSGIRRDPLFPRRMWSCHRRVLNNEPRTNNYSEAAHRALQVKHDNYLLTEYIGYLGMYLLCTLSYS